MGSLFASLATASESLRSFERALSVTSNNVTNANTPGYVRQQVNFVAQRLQLDLGLPGGVRAAGLLSSRDSYLEQAVRQQSQQASGTDQRAALLKQIEPIFDISSGSGISGALDSFQSAVSQWTVGPNDYPARQNVIRAAGKVAHAFQTTSHSLEVASQSASSEITATVSTINKFGSKLAQLNGQIRADARNLEDAGLDAQIHATLEELSQYSDFTVLRAEDGTFSVYLGHQTPFVLGDKTLPIRADLSGTQAAFRDSSGRDITSQFGDGKIKALSDFQSTFLPGIRADLNRLAGTFADQVNATLGGGLDATGQAPMQQFLTYSATNGIAASLAVGITSPDALAAAAPGAPGGNGNALLLAEKLARRNIDNFTYTQFFGEIAGRVGKALAGAQEDQKTQHQLLAQVQAVREEHSKISLDEEAANLVQFQRAYEATAKMFQTLDEMTQTIIGLKR